MTIPRNEKKIKEIYPKLKIKKKFLIIKSQNLPKPDLENFKIKLPSIEKKSSFINLLDKVNYDIDFYDYTFISKFNKDFPIIIFEYIFDRLEKEWTFQVQNLLKNVQQPSFTDTFCDICSYSDTKLDNSLIYCDGCNLCVHQECYGVPIIPDKYWLCKRCLFGNSESKCEFCIVKSGALKPISNGKFGHLICTIFNPNISFLNAVFKEPLNLEKEFNFIEDFTCKICQTNNPSLINCNFVNCTTKFHVTCAIENNYYFDLNNVVTYCNKHNPSLKKHCWVIEDFFGVNSLSFKKIEKKPKIRQNLPLHSNFDSEFLKISKMNPYFTNECYKRLFKELSLILKDETEFILKSIIKYFIEKNSLYKKSFLSELNPFECVYDFEEWINNRDKL